MSARAFAEQIDRSLYAVKLFGLTKDGEWITGDDAIERLEKKCTFPKGTPKLNEEILRELTSCDVTIPIFHGQQGEDGMTQGFLELLNIPYVGCDYRSWSVVHAKGVD